MKDNKLNVDELYEFIIKIMTPKQALIKMIEANINGYNLLKHNIKYVNGEEIHPLMLIVMAANELDWSIALKNHDDDANEDVMGIIVGTEEYVESVLDIADDDKFISKKFISNNACCGGYDSCCADTIKSTTISNACCGGNSCQGCDPNDTDAKTTYDEQCCGGCKTID